MDKEWVKNPKNNPQPELVMVEIKGCDYLGEWISKAMRKDFKKPPPGTSKKTAKKAFRKGWRWVDENHNPINDQAVEEWRPITP